MKFPLPIAVVSVCLAALGMWTARSAPQSCTGTAVIHRHAFLPSAAQRHGEVRLVSVGDCANRASCTCSCVRVETILFSRMLARGLHRIRQEEARAWPVDFAGHADSVKYLEALQAATQVVLGPAQASPDVNQPVQAEAPLRTLAIEFERSKQGARIRLQQVRLSGTEGDGPVVVESRSLIREVPVSVDYVKQNFGLMLAKGFDVEPSVVAAWLDEAESRAGLKEP